MSSHGDLIICDGGTGHLLKARGVQARAARASRCPRNTPAHAAAAPCARTAAAAVTARWQRRPSLHPRFLLPTCQHLVPGLKYDELFLAGALANSLAPEAVLGVHGEYTAAGADVITVSPTSWPALLLAQQVCVPVGVPGPLPVPPVPQFFWLFCCCAGQQLLLHRVVPGPHRPS